MMISVIVPVYNAEKRIAKCLDSLVNQTYQNLEIIVINDGSCDDSDKIILGFCDKFPDKIKYISRDNKGIGYTRNEAIRLSNGEYVGFVDSDDYVESDMFEKLYNAIRQFDADIAVCNYKIFREASNENIYKNVEVTLAGTNLLVSPCMLNSMDFAPWNKLYKKKLFDDIAFPENLKYEDLNAIIKVFAEALKIVKIDDYCYNYYVNPTGETVTINEKIYDIFDILEDLLRYFENSDKNLAKQLKILCSRKLFVYTELSLNKGDINFSLNFLDNVYKFLNSNFSGWRFDYVTSSSNLKTFCLRIIQMFRYFYIMRLKIKLKKME